MDAARWKVELEVEVQKSKLKRYSPSEHLSCDPSAMRSFAGSMDDLLGNSQFALLMDAGVWWGASLSSDIEMSQALDDLAYLNIRAACVAARVGIVGYWCILGHPQDLVKIPARELSSARGLCRRVGQANREYLFFQINKDDFNHAPKVFGDNASMARSRKEFLELGELISCEDKKSGGKRL